MEILGLVVLFIGVIFCALGVVGIMRFPDVYTRLHAAGLISTLGIVALGIGASLLMPSLTLKMIALVLFFVVRWMNRLRRPDTPAAPTTQACPRCRSSIDATATRCAFCTSDLTAADGAAASPAT